jgi:type II secretory ATPase GspE/PulE/Tfp pilus assembly ATPase PilB-like protein
MVGEIRDTETARIITDVALAGHIVFSTVYTNNATGAITRLMDMGIEPFLVSSTIRAVISQRLVRIICEKCKKPYELLKHEFSELGLTEDKIKGKRFYKGEGCLECNGSGYKGRTGIYELFIMDDKIKELVVKRASLAAIRKVAQEGGMKTLRQDAVSKILKGITTAEEVLRETKEYAPLV